MYLEVENVCKKIKEDYVLKNVTLSMEKGRIYGIQGKNGCGKSMLMRVICGLVLPTAGRIVIAGEELGKELSFPRSIGVLIEHPGFLNGYSGFQNLKILASVSRKADEDEIRRTLERVGLSEDMNKKYRKYSLGMKQKLGIAAAVMEQPEIVMLDEPANGLDEKSEQRMWEIIREEKERGALVIVACHDSEALETAADELFRMKNGEIIDHIIK